MIRSCGREIRTPRHIMLASLLGMSALTVFSAGRTGVTEVEKDTVRDLPGVAVTAIKQLIPAYADESVTSLGSVTIDRLDLSDVKQLSGLAPNFYMPKYGSAMTSTIYVRGLGTRIDQPVVGLNIDNVPLVCKDNFDFQLSDVSSVQVIRGPQNILYGRNTMGGLINITTISPLKYEGIRARALYGTRNTWRFDAGLYKKLSDRVGLSATLYGGGSDGYHKNTYNGTRAGATANFGARLKTVWQSRRGHTLQNTATFSHTSQRGYPYQSVETGKISYNDTCFYRRLTFIDGLTAKGDVGNVNLSAIGSFQYINDNLTLDQDFLPQDYFTLTQKRHEWSVTADFVASSRKPAGGFYSWLAGAFGFARRVNMHAPVTFYDYGLSQLIEGNANAMSPQYPIRWDQRNLLLDSDFVLPSRGFSLYHESVFRTGRFDFTLGLRWDWEQARIRYRSQTSSSYTIYDATGEIEKPYRPGIRIDIDDRGRLSQIFSQLLPKLSVSYRLPSSLGNVYASITKGYKSGGYNTQMFSDVLQQKLMGHLGIMEQYGVDEIITYSPEKIWNYEAGGHLRFFDGRLRTEVALFWIECRDQQITMFPEGTVTGRVMANAGKARSRGFELSAEGQPGGGFTLRASYGFTDARFTKFNDGKNDYAGRHVPYAPSHTLWAGAVWSHAMPGRFIDKVTTLVNVQGAGPIWWNESNNLRQSFYALLDASVSASHGDFTAELKATNITATRYSTFYFVSIGNAFLQRGDGFGLTLCLKWNLNL